MEKCIRMRGKSVNEYSARCCSFYDNETVVLFKKEVEKKQGAIQLMSLLLRQLQTAEALLFFCFLSDR